MTREREDGQKTDEKRTPDTDTHPVLAPPSPPSYKASNLYVTLTFDSWAPVRKPSMQTETNPPSTPRAVLARSGRGHLWPRLSFQSGRRHEQRDWSDVKSDLLTFQRAGRAGLKEIAGKTTAGSPQASQVSGTHTDASADCAS